MNITENSVVEFHYDMLEDDEVLESSRSGESVMMLVGHKNMLAGVEAAMIGKQAGDHAEVTLEPQNAYGELKPASIQRIPTKHLMGAKKWRPGMIATVQTEQGRRQVTVVKVGKFNADCDLNHPLAGKTLTFKIEIISVREAQPEELSHGHVHGRGGVHH